MELLSKLRTLFKSPPAIVPPPALYSDEEFLEFIAAQARNRSREAQATSPNPAAPAAPLNHAA